MLVLTRKTGEEIRIGHDIVIKVNDIQRGRVRLGIQAPKYVTVDRLEIASRKQQVPPLGNTTVSGTKPPCPA